MKIGFIYFSGTGNTKHLIDKMVRVVINQGHEASLFSIEKPLKVTDLMELTLLIIACPIYGSTTPRIMRAFLDKHGDELPDIPVAIIITQHKFSGDGAMQCARILKKKNKTIIATEHFLMPANLSDAGIFSVDSHFKRQNITQEAEIKSENFIKFLLQNYANNQKQLPLKGKAFFWRIAGSLQRLPFLALETAWIQLLNVDRNRCTLCGLCAKHCPTKNLTIQDEKLFIEDKCTLCYRCVNICPTQALAFLKKPGSFVQYQGCSGEIIAEDDFFEGS